MIVQGLRGRVGHSETRSLPVDWRGRFSYFAGFTVTQVRTQSWRSP